MNTERMYSVLLEPHFSEKMSIVGEAHNQYGFKVALDATKAEIKQAVEALFSVSVDKVTTVNVKGKTKRAAGGRSIRGKRWKKAYVRVSDGQEIDFMVVD